MKKNDPKGLNHPENTHTRTRVTPSHHDLKKRQAQREIEAYDNVRSIHDAPKKKKKRPSNQPQGRPASHRSRPARSQKKTNKLAENLFLGNKLFIGLGVIVACAILYVAFIRPNSIRVMVGDKAVATIPMSNITAENFEETIITRLQVKLETNIRLNEEITFRPVNTRANGRVTPEQAADRVIDSVSYMQEAGEIFLNGEYIATVSSVEGGRAIIEDIAREMLPGGANIIDIYAEGVTITPTFIDNKELADLHGVAAVLRASTREITPYIVTAGDSPWLIANRFGMTLSDLSELNGNMDVNNTNIREGDVLMVSMDVPFLTIHTEEELEVITDIEPDTEQSNNPNQPVGFSSVIRAGVPGQVRDVFKIKRTNGIETERVPLGTEILTEPVNFLIEVGTGGE